MQRPVCLWATGAKIQESKDDALIIHHEQRRWQRWAQCQEPAPDPSDPGWTRQPVIQDEADQEQPLQVHGRVQRHAVRGAAVCEQEARGEGRRGRGTELAHRG